MTTFTRNFVQAFSAVLLLLLLATLNAAQTTAQQTEEKEPQPISADVTKGPTPAPDKALSEIEQLSRKVEQLETLIGRQNQTLMEMQRQLEEVKSVQSNMNRPATLQMANANIAPEPVEVADKKNPTAGAATAQAASTPQDKGQKTLGLLAGWDGNHAFLRSADGDFQTNLTGYSQLDFRGYQQGNHPPNSFLLRRARLAVEGKLFRYFDFKVEGDFADIAGTLARDVYLRVHRTDSLQLTFGQFREPYSQEELRPDSVQDFVERSLVNNLAPSRSPGLMLSGVLKKGILEYQVGAFNGKGLLGFNTTGTPEGVVRLRYSPWKNSKDYWTRGLAFGGAYGLGRNTGTSVRGLMESRSFIYFIPDTANGPVTHANGELTWLVGPASFRAEYDQVNQTRTALGPGGTNLPGVVAKGFMGQFTYLLTGEDKPDVGPTVPKRNLFGGETGGGRGAWELKLRFSDLQISDGTPKSNRGQSIYFGANWYLNRFVRYVFDYGIELYQDPLRTPRPGDRTFHVVLSRIQVSF